MADGKKYCIMALNIMHTSSNSVIKLRCLSYPFKLIIVTKILEGGKILGLDITMAQYDRHCVSRLDSSLLRDGTDTPIYYP